MLSYLGAKCFQHWTHWVGHGIVFLTALVTGKGQIQRHPYNGKIHPKLTGERRVQEGTMKGLWPLGDELGKLKVPVNWSSLWECSLGMSLNCSSASFLFMNKNPQNQGRWGAWGRSVTSSLGWEVTKSGHRCSCNASSHLKKGKGISHLPLTAQAMRTACLCL